MKELRSLADDMPGACANPKYSVRIDASLTDPFARLPPELRMQIATLLTTADYLNLRLASRTMAALFHGNTFWKSRFRKHGSRSFWSDIATDGAADGEGPVDWPMIYHATSKLRSRLEFATRVWDIALWIRDALAALHMPSVNVKPLSFAGSALREYRGDETVGGDRIVRTRISPGLASIAISYSCSLRPTKACASGIVIHTVKVFALEFQYTNGDTVTVGTPHSEAMERWSNSQKKIPRLCDCFRGHLVFDAESFAGFCAHYHPDETIASLGVLQQEKEAPVSLAGGPQATPLVEMRMNEVVEVVTTFRGPILVDIGIRGRGYLAPPRSTSLFHT
ncbi:hypothetical protein BJY00DRAFT_308088 [Aspergillus carlsbadensis]|nr:hypothetical protein BJY00DRAFT_308088 [Aspergillus carlsbadensis]